MRSHRACAPIANDVARVARVTLAKHDLTGLELARHGELRDPLEIALDQSREHRNVSEKLDDLL
jgi:hypothetical protein